MPSVCHFREKLYAYEPHLILGIVASKLFHRHFKVVGLACLEIFVNVVNMVFVHDLIQEIVYIELRSAVYDSLNLCKKVLKVYVLWKW